MQGRAGEGCRGCKGEEAVEGGPLPADRVRRVRNGEATLNYIAQGRPDLSLTAKVLSKRMASRTARSFVPSYGVERVLCSENALDVLAHPVSEKGLAAGLRRMESHAPKDAVVHPMERQMRSLFL